MLTELSIENFAIVERLRVHFQRGFTVITGETGAGKSIIIDALQTALGHKVGPDVVRDGEGIAVVEAVFDYPEAGGDDDLDAALREYGIADEGCLILRREISSLGRGTGRVNGRGVPLSVLHGLGSLLVDIHGQSDHLSILRHDRQLDVLDRYGGLQGFRADVGQTIKEYTRLRRELEELAAGRREAEQRLDLLRFQVHEIESARLMPDEEAELETERRLLANAERLRELSAQAYDSLRDESGGAVDGVRASSLSTHDISSLDPTMEHIAARLKAVEYELEDVAQELRQYRDSVEHEPRRLEAVEERLDLLTRLKRKYGPTLADVIAFGEHAVISLDEAENFDERLTARQEQVQGAEARAGHLAERLSVERRKAGRDLSEAVSIALADVGLKAGRFEVEIARTASSDGLPIPRDDVRYVYGRSGIDTVRFLVSFNPGEPLRPFDKVASGGETSRFLLAVKSVLAEADQTPTLIFDEVDVGVGARGAMDVGEKMRTLSTTHQVISITHLPQIAALADVHLTVSKMFSQGRAAIRVQSLEATERVTELAEMISGKGTEASKRSAEELLESARHAK